MRKLILLGALMLAACIPGQMPTVLNTTPASGVVMTRDTYRNDLFSVVYPESWRVITSAASAPPSVIFAAPDNCTIIVVSSTPVDQTPPSPSCTQSDIKTFSQTLSAGGRQISVVGSAPAADWDAFKSAFDHLVASVQL